MIDDTTKLVEELLTVSRQSLTAAGASLAECLATRRRILEQLSSSKIARPDVAQLREAAELGRQTRVRVLVETAQVRQEIQDLEAVRRGLSQFRPIRKTSQQVDVRI